MNKKIVIRLVLVSIFLINISISYAQNEKTPLYQDSQHRIKPPKLVEPSVDGIYQIGDITIKFFPPSGWKKLDLNIPSPGFDTVDFMYSKSGELGGPLLSISVLALLAEPTEFMEQMKGEDGSLAYGSHLLKEEDITFLNTKAYSCITISKEKTKQKNIVFTKADKAYNISFTAKEGVFDNFLPIADESLKTFEIISPAPK